MRELALLERAEDRDEVSYYHALATVREQARAVANGIDEKSRTHPVQKGCGASLVRDVLFVSSGSPSAAVQLQIGKNSSGDAVFVQVSF
ncbi:hypothetical protein MRY87_09505 [bacterium]|nr:hypothetical protein [bacterium]